MSSNPEAVWAELLSEDDARVSGALRRLGPPEREQVLAHLRRMAGEPGWSAGQARRARAALAIAADPPVPEGHAQGS